MVLVSKQAAVLTEIGFQKENHLNSTTRKANFAFVLCLQ